MANKVIKGLTVEIGGDTTKLGKALTDVEKQGRSLSSELGSINRLLKMDPGNTELLAQKQKVLAEAVESTRKKLDTLKEAERQVQSQFERGEVSEEQVRALKREIIATASKMEAYEKATMETAEAIDKLGDTSKDLQTGTKKTKKGAEEAAESLDDMSDAAEKAEKTGGGLGSKLGGVVKGGLAAVAGAATALVGALAGCAEASREYRTDLGKLDTAFTTEGHSSETALKTYKTLQGILGESDVAVEAANHLAKLTKNEKDLATWTNIATGVYATFGASLPIEGLTEAANETAKTGALTGSLADALNWAGVNEDGFQTKLDACTNEQERQALITETLNGLYADAAERYRSVNEELIRANEANEAWMASMSEAGEAVEPILTDVKMLGASLLSDLMPGVTGVAGALRNLLNGDAGAASETGEALSGIITNLLSKVTEMAPTITEVAMSLISTLTTMIIMTLPQLVDTGTQMMVSVLEGLTQTIPQITAALVDMIPQLATALTTGIPQLIQAALDLFMALVQAIPQIIPPLVAALPQIVTAIVSGLESAVPQLIQGAAQLLTAIVQAIPLLIETLAPQIPSIVTTIIDVMIANIPVLLEGAVQLLDAIVQAIPLIIEALVPQIPAIVNTIVDELGKMAPVLLAASVKLLWEIIKAIPQIAFALLQNLPQILEATFSVLGMLPALIWSVLDNIITKVDEWISIMINKACVAGSNVVNAVVSYIKELPGSVWTWLKSTADKVVEFGAKAVANARNAAQLIAAALINGVKSLPSEMQSIGADLVRGLWNGISNMVGWVKDKIKGFSNDVLNGIKSFFGVHSPSTKTAWIGEMLDRGLAQGVLDNMDVPMNAMANVADGMLGEAGGLNGVTLERQLNTTFRTEPVEAESGLMGRLDKILEAIDRGQILTIDGDSLVGATVDKLDNMLGQRRTLVARGAI